MEGHTSTRSYFCDQCPSKVNCSAVARTLNDAYYSRDHGYTPEEVEGLIKAMSCLREAGFSYPRGQEACGFHFWSCDKKRALLGGFVEMDPVE